MTLVFAGIFSALRNSTFANESEDDNNDDGADKTNDEKRKPNAKDLVLFSSTNYFLGKGHMILCSL